MTFEQLSIFVAVAEREHLTKAAASLLLTPSAASSAIKALEAFYGVALFNRVGRRIELTEAGRLFLDEAKAVLARAQSAELVLAELGGLRRGALAIAASQTVASHWLPPILMRFHDTYPGIALDLVIGNTRSVAEAVLEGTAEIGFVEGRTDLAAVSATTIAIDELVIVVPPTHPWAEGRPLSADELATGSSWVLREEGSGTRDAFAAVLEAHGLTLDDLTTVLTLPSNEAVLSATRAGRSAAVVSRAAALPYLHQGALIAADFALPARDFALLRHKQRRASETSRALEAMCRDAA